MTEIIQLPIESYADAIKTAHIDEVHNFPGIVVNLVTLGGRRVLLIQANDTFIQIAA